jgi:hypothetical protein
LNDNSEITLSLLNRLTRRRKVNEAKRMTDRSGNKEYQRREQLLDFQKYWRQKQSKKESERHVILRA